jgi:hypothetical protein
MKFQVQVVLVLVLCASSSSLAQLPTDYDAVRDFSITSNPNGVWSYGWSTVLGGPMTLYATGNGDCITGLSDWREVSDCPDVVPQPNLAHNDTGASFCHQTFCIPPSLLDLHPGANGEYSILRWTAPARGSYLVQGTFAGVDFAPTTTDVHAVLNTKHAMLNASVNDFADPLFFQQVVTVQAGDTVDFEVGYGRDADWGFDGTGVSFKVTKFR